MTFDQPSPNELQGYVFAFSAEEVLANKAAVGETGELAVLRNQAVSAWLQAAVGVRSDKHREQAWRNAVGMLRAMNDNERADQVEKASTSEGAADP